MSEPVQQRPAIFNDPHVVKLFTDMAATYGAVNLVSSLGFAHLWRMAAARALQVEAGQRVLDLMTGRGEASTLLAKEVGDLSITALDFCPEMCRRASGCGASKTARHFEVRCEDVLCADFQSSCHRVICTFGIKTLADDALNILARKVHDALLPEGRAAFVEIHLPPGGPLRLIYSSYIRFIIPLVGRMFLGDPECYRWLHRYTVDFAKRDCFDQQLRAAGFNVSASPLWFGCAKLYEATKLGS